MDVLHYLFEEDLVAGGSGEMIKARHALRKTVYETLYERPYTFMSGGGDVPTEANASSGSLESAVATIPPNVRPYIPPTPLSDDPDDPFAGIIEPPLG